MQFAYALDLNNQYTAANTNHHVSKLAEASSRDTAAVKWITYLTLFYLPGSFIAVSSEPPALSSQAEKMSRPYMV